MLGSAPAASSAFTASACFCSTAHINAVVPRIVSRALTSAPASSSTLIACGLPLLAANITIVSLLGPFCFASAPALINLSITIALPYIAAISSGVTPVRFAALMLAPARISRSTISGSCLYTAQCSAVAPAGTRDDAGNEHPQQRSTCEGARSTHLHSPTPAWEGGPYCRLASVC